MIRKLRNRWWNSSGVVCLVDMKKMQEAVSAIEKAEARQQFENQLRYAFVKYDHFDDDEEHSEVFSYICMVS